MIEILFIAALGLPLTALLFWGFRTLPGERWQILATIPLSKDEDGHWRGLNLTWYGLLSATSYVIATALVFVLAGSIYLPPLVTLLIVVLILAVAMPASQLVARMVEKKKHTLTVAGAFFVAVIFTPFILWGVNAGLGDALGLKMGMQIPVMPVMATLAIAYTFGEGIGRLACISFGCCYGKPVHTAHPLLARLFARWNFVFLGNTKKIAYASGLAGTQVIPIQALTAVLYVGSGLVAALLFLKSFYLTAFVLTLVVTQVWRFISEMLRADYRGQGKLSAYQIMALAATLYAIVIGLWLSDVPVQAANLSQGLQALWNPAMLLFLQLLWIVSFIYTGKSSVTEARLAINVCHDKI